VAFRKAHHPADPMQRGVRAYQNGSTHAPVLGTMHSLFANTLGTPPSASCVRSVDGTLQLAPMSSVVMSLMSPPGLAT
jgi:hypothetical protein